MDEFSLSGNNPYHHTMIQVGSVTLQLAASMGMNPENGVYSLSFESNYVLDENGTTTNTLDGSHVDAPAENKDNHLTVGTSSSQNFVTNYREFTIACDPIK